MSDIRQAFRTLRANPAFTLAAVLVLALGIGANSAMFALIDAVLLKPLPVREPDRLVVLSTVEPGSPGVEYSFSYPAFQDLRNSVPAFSGVLATSGLRVSVSYNGRNLRCPGELVSGSYFTTLGVQPFLGRLLTPDDDRVLGGHPLIVLDYEFWQRLGADRGIVGRGLVVNGQPMTIVGVTPREFYGTELAQRPAIRVPMTMAPVLRPGAGDLNLTQRTHQWLKVMSRLGPGVTLEKARAAASVVFAADTRALIENAPPGASEQDRKRVAGRRLDLRDGAQGIGRMQRDARLPILLLGGATLALLLVACANLANLLLARNTNRAREFAVRGALGGSRWRIARQVLVENLLLSGVAGMLGFLLSFWISGAILSFLPSGNALGTDLAPDARVALATLVISMAAGALFGLVPAWRSAGQDPGAALKADQPTMASGDGVFSLRSTLVVAQFALSFVLLVGAGLFLRTLNNLNHVDTGFARDHVLVATLDPSLNGDTRERANALLSDFVQRVAGIPGVTSAGLSSVSPITHSWDVYGLQVPGYHPKDGEEPEASAVTVSPGYLEAMRIEVKQGRLLTWRDGAGAPAVAVINETMARDYFDGAALGRRFSFGDRLPAFEVVGVVADGKYVDLREERVPRFVYLSFLQSPFPAGEMTLHARTSGDPMRSLDAVTRELRALDPALPLSGVSTLEGQIAESLSSERILATLGSAFGVLALLLAAVGVYGVLAFAVARRTREIGLRMALGARPAEASWMVLRQVAASCAVGLLAGLAGVVALQGAARSVLYGVAPVDGLVLVGAFLALTSMAALAAWLPARRAARLDPLAALRHE
jgi:predicted permease